MAQMISVRLGASETTRTTPLVAAGDTGDNAKPTSQIPAQRHKVFKGSFNSPAA